jgi:hypothetical protein
LQGQLRFALKEVQNQTAFRDAIRIGSSEYHHSGSGRREREISASFGVFEEELLENIVGTITSISNSEMETKP